MKDIAAHERIKFLHILQEVVVICKTCNHLSSSETRSPKEYRTYQNSFRGDSGVLPLR